MKVVWDSPERGGRYAKHTGSPSVLDSLANQTTNVEIIVVVWVTDV